MDKGSSIDYNVSNLSDANYSSSWYKELDSVKIKIKKIELLQKQQSDFHTQSILIEEKYNNFLEFYPKESAKIREQNNLFQLTLHQNHQNGKYVFKKGNELVLEYKNNRANEKDVDLTKALVLGDEVLNFLNKLISLGSTDTKELDTVMKDAKTPTEVKHLLGF